MKNIIIQVLIFTLLLINTGLLNTADSSSTKKEEKIAKLIINLQGGVPSKEIKYIDGELLSLNNKKVKLSNYEGKVIFLNLWATWCSPCRNEMPSMQKLYNDFKDKDFVIIAVDMGEDLETVKAFAKNNGYTFPIFTDPNNDIANSYSTGSIPTTYIIDKAGNLRARFVGGRDWYSNDAVELFRELLK